jgi:hypothetical protein
MAPPLASQSESEPDESLIRVTVSAMRVRMVTARRPDLRSPSQVAATGGTPSESPLSEEVEDEEDASGLMTTAIHIARRRARPNGPAALQNLMPRAVAEGRMSATPPPSRNCRRPFPGRDRATAI